MRRLGLAVLVAAGAAQAQPPTLPLGPPDTLTNPDPAPPPPNVWQPRTVAELQVLDKVYARRGVLNVKVGESGAFGTLSIGVGACVVRPPDRAPDAAAFLTVADRGAAAPSFSGWMLRSAPAASMLEHPVYDVRVQACR